jgi:hypothetical protein
VLRLLFHDSRVGLTKRGLKVREHALRVWRIWMKEPLQSVQRELLDRGDGQRARLLSGGMSTHPVGHEKDTSLLIPMLCHRLRQAGLQDPHRLIQFGDEKLIFVHFADTPSIGQTKTTDRTGLASDIMG